MGFVMGFSVGEAVVVVVVVARDVSWFGGWSPDGGGGSSGVVLRWAGRNSSLTKRRRCWRLVESEAGICCLIILVRVRPVTIESD